MHTDAGNFKVTPVECLDARVLLPALDLPLLMSSTSAWIEHIPFAFFLMGLLHPRTFVELGTQRGDSYCAFCQTVEHLALQTRCTAIDTWRGDKHTGRYGPHILKKLRAHHDPLYSRFSTLFQSTFAQAAAGIPDASIDLLHLDGCHAYDAARNDFEIWRPKLSDRGVVLLHDTQVRKRGFGVWKLWSEIASQFPSFEFVHGYGLGLLAIGPSPPAGLRRFLKNAAHAPDPIRSCFAALGERVLLVRAASKSLPLANILAADRVQLRQDLQSLIPGGNSWSDALECVALRSAQLRRQLEEYPKEYRRIRGRPSLTTRAIARAENIIGALTSAHDST